MRAVALHKPEDVRVERVADPIIQTPHDVILRVTSTAICGSDLHVYSGMIRQKRPMVMGHVLHPFACDLDAAHPGAQAELVRVPQSRVLHRIPEQLSDGESVAVFGCGPVGIMAQKCAWLQGATGSETIAANDHEQAPKACEIFAKRTDNCVKVVLKPGMAMAA